MRLDRIFSSGRSERATITISKLYIYLILPCIIFQLFPNFVSDVGPHVALFYVEIFLFIKLLINCLLLSVGNSIKTSGSSGWCEYNNVTMRQTVGL